MNNHGSSNNEDHSFEIRPDEHNPHFFLDLRNNNNNEHNPHNHLPVAVPVVAALAVAAAARDDHVEAAAAAEDAGTALRRRRRRRQQVDEEQQQQDQHEQQRVVWMEGAWPVQAAAAADDDDDETGDMEARGSERSRGDPRQRVHENDRLPMANPVPHRRQQPVDENVGAGDEGADESDDDGQPEAILLELDEEQQQQQQPQQEERLDVDVDDEMQYVDMILVEEDDDEVLDSEEEEEQLLHQPAAPRRALVRPRVRQQQHQHPFRRDRLLRPEMFRGGAVVANVSSATAVDSPFLTDLIREDAPCESILTGRQVRGCNRVVQRCQTHSREIYYVCPRTGRSPLHEAALQCSCLHVLQAIMQIDPSRSMDLDHAGNAPLHLLFVGVSTRRVYNLDALAAQLLEPGPLFLACITNREGMVPLHFCCSAPESMITPSTVELLLQANPACAARLNNKNQTALHLHCRRRHASTAVAELLTTAYPEAMRILDRTSIQAQQNQQQQQQHQVMAAAAAARNNNNNAAAAAAAAVAATTAGYIPLHYAAANANTELIQLLVEKDPSTALIRKTPEDQTALHILCRHVPGPAHLPAIQALLQAAPETVCWTDGPATAYTALHCLCRSNHPVISVEVVQALLTASNNDVARITDANHYLPLHYACEGGHADPAVIRCLIQAYPAAASVLTRKHDTALSLACATNQSVEIVQMLLAANPSATLQANHYGFIPLHCVCRAYQPMPAIVQALLLQEPASVVVTTHAGEKAVHLASNNAGAAVSVLEWLTQTYQEYMQSHQQQEGGGAASASAMDDQTGRKTDAQAITSLLQPSHSPLMTQQQQRQDSLFPLPSRTRSTTTSSSNAMDVDQNTSSSRGEHVMVESPLDFQMPDSSNNDSNNNNMTNKVGNTPLHFACFHGSARDHIETLAVSNPKWITVRNNAGYSPLQILCKNGRIDDRIITLFSRIAGPEIFATVDLMGNTPLHSAMREETDVEALRALIHAYPDALRMKTIYDDTPLHLACFRRVDPGVVREAALASSHGLERTLANCNGRISPLLVKNTAGQTPIGIAMEEFQRACRESSLRLCCCVKADYNAEQKRSFEVLAVLVKLLHYGPAKEEDRDKQSLVGACVALHRRDVRLDPVFIRRALYLCPEEAKILDDAGNYPLHIEASIPVEKMSLLDGPDSTCCHGTCHSRLGVLRMLLEIFPEATQHRNSMGDFPLSLMIQNGRCWDSTFALVLRTFPEAFHWVRSIHVPLLPRILEKISNECGIEALFGLIRSRPIMFSDRD